MRRIFLLFTMIVATAVSAMAQDEYEGQPVTVNLASGESITSELSLGSLEPRLVNGEIVWIAAEGSDRPYEIKNVTSVEFQTPEQSLTAAREALVKFYQAMDGDHWANNTNWCSDKPLDEWFGVKTFGYPYVWELNLLNNSLKGELPDKGVFSGMGPIASIFLGSDGEAGNLTKNQISGTIPSDWIRNSNLLQIRAYNNQLTGELPEELFELPYFSYLDISENQMTGNIPSGIVRLMNDKSVNIWGNDFSGTVPEAIVNHPNFHLIWNSIIPQSGHLTLPDIPGYRLSVTDLDGNTFNTADVYKNNTYTLIFNYWMARGDFMGKLKKAYDSYKNKGFEVLGMAPGDIDEINEFIHTNNVSWLNLDPKTFTEYFGWYYAYVNFINLIDKDGNIVFTSIMDDDGKAEDQWGTSTRDQKVFDVLADKFGKADFTPYASTDFSRDGEVLTLQKASKGNGVDIVFVGNCFVDKDMEPGGFYEQKMTQAMEQFFSYEPYTSLRDRFNVYAVKAVSPNAEMFEGCQQAIASDADAFNYAKKVKDLIPDRPLRVNVIYNTLNGGRSYTTMYDDHSYVAVMLTGVNRVLNHEGGGHGIGRLYDEYVENNGSTATDEAKDYFERMWSDHGLGANVDIHADVKETRWAHFAADGRYTDEKLGAYEGGGGFQFGIYRPTENSMMRYNDMPFNAPSREAIYKNVMKESEGAGWKYDYETFVNFDAKGREQFVSELNAAKSRAMKADGQSPTTDKKPQTLPPVMVRGTWQDALKNPIKIKYHD